jgi:hypothetical protein
MIPFNYHHLYYFYVIAISLDFRLSRHHLDSLTDFSDKGGQLCLFIHDPDSKDPNCGISLVQSRIGLRVVADAMHPRKRNQIDVLFDTKPITLGGKKVNPAIALGYCKDVEIRVIGRIDTAKMPKTQTELAAMMGAAPFAVR